MTKGRYVDDISGGADTPEQLLAIAQQLTNLCRAGGFPLAKWKSNSPTLFTSVTSNQSSTSEHSFDSSNIKVLGLSWSPSSDTLHFSLNAQPRTQVTKRAILSDIVQIFDPLGFFSPIIIRAKVLLQSLWLEKLDRDDAISSSLTQRWVQFQQDFSNMSQATIPRSIGVSADSCTLQIHGFSDASQLALSETKASRGLSSSQLKNHPLWWTGPSWLPLNQQFWPSTSLNSSTLITSEELLLLRITARCQRAIAVFRHSSNTFLNEPLSSMEIDKALLYWIHSTQPAHFTETISLISQLQPLSNSNSLLRLPPFLDSAGTLRVGGRFQHSPLDANSKNLIILPRHSSLSTLFIADSHLRTLHGGTQATISLLRQRFWIVGGRAPVRSYIRRCVICARHRRIRAQQLTGQLPSPRVTPSRPFLHTGVDYAGPVTLKTWAGRGAKTHKGWLAIFVCLSTSALHLEVVSDYSADKFLAAYRRLVGRRGICHTLYSDCGTTFQGADSSLKLLFKAASAEHLNLAQILSADGTFWHFIPPAAPHFGGKWEAAVKSVKFHLRRTIGDTSMTFEELTTLLAQIESILNSRPLSSLSDDPDDLAALTPGHFLIGEPLNFIPEPSLALLPTSRLDRWQFLQPRVQYFWSRWSSECLQRYLSSSKWHHSSNTLREGSLVLISDERLPPSKWPLVRIPTMHPGSDDLTRVVILRTTTSTLKRPISKLAILPPFTQEDVALYIPITPEKSTDNDVAVAMAGGNVKKIDSQAHT